MIQQTSLESFIKIQMNGRLNANQQIILDVFKNHDPLPLSNSDVANILGWSINRVTPRVLELRSIGKLSLATKKIDLRSNMTVNAWGLSDTINFFSRKQVFGGKNHE